MNKILLVIILFFVFNTSAISQNRLYLTPLKYTATGFTTFNQVCYQPNGIEYYLNSVKWVEGVDYTQGFCAYGICQITFPFGTFKVGDNFEVKDNCGSISATRIIEDDFVYVEVPIGASYAGNDIGPNDETPPYSRLSNKIVVGKCEPVNINAHGLHQMGIFLGTVDAGPSYTSGIFLINGSPIQFSDFNIDTFENPNAVSYSVNANGSVTYNNKVGLNTKINYSGRTPFEFEYRHNGVLPFDVQEFGLGALGLRIYSNTRITVKDRAYTGTTETEILGVYTNSIFKFTYDGANFKLFIDGNLIKTIPRSVIYSSSSGTISNSNLLPYGSGITWTPTNSGNQWVKVIVDGVLITRQAFSVVDDMVINETVTNVGCVGANTGGILVNVNGGKAPFQYAINTGAFGASANLTGLSAGNYIVKVKDASGCEVSKSVTVGENQGMSLVASSKTNSNCNGQATGSIILSGSGGLGALQYSKDNITYQNSNTFSGLTAGNYTFWVKDVAGCTKSLTETIGTNSTLVGVANVSTAIACNGASTGAISFTSSGTASGLIQYSINGTSFQSGSVFSGLSANTYSVAIKDDFCIKSLGTITLTAPTALTISPAINQNVSCFGGAEGKITVAAAGGTGALQYSKDGINFGSSNVFTSLPANNYKIWVKDANGCTQESNIVSITEPVILAVTINGKTDVKCNGQATGSVVLLGSGGTVPYEYSKDGINFSSNATIGGLAVGAYTFTLKDSKGCLKTVSSNILEAPALVIAPPIITNLTCNGDNSGQIIVNATGGVGPYTFSKDNVTFQSAADY